MEFEFSNNSLDKISADVLLVFSFEDGRGLNGLIAIDKVSKGSLLNALKVSKFEGKRGESFAFYPQQGFLASSVFVLGLGKKSEFTANDLRRAVGSFAGKTKKKFDSVALILPSQEELSISEEVISQMVAEGFLLGNYQFNKYKSKKDKEERILSTVILSNSSSKEIKKGIEKAKLFSQATILARDLVNEQAQVATPTFLADLAKDLARKDKNITCRIYDKQQAEKLGMGAFLGIAKAAAEVTPPKFIHLEYKASSKAKRKLAIVGKGITFDSGGINVKTGSHMSDMKMDMSGAAIVLAVFSVISKIKPDFDVIGLVAATPNLISGTSLVPGDVVKALNGKTIEVLDTDAEGRVTLADSLSYAVKEGATEIIDFATLTGACMVALGDEISGLFSNNQDLSSRIKKAAYDAGEKMWELPLEKDYKEMNKSDVADIANIPNSRYGGALTAALFLEEFVGNKAWAHLDIAGPAFASKTGDLGPKGGTGHGVRTVLNLLS
jgi:leucyl aminopeptidase